MSALPRLLLPLAVLLVFLGVLPDYNTATPVALPMAAQAPQQFLQDEETYNRLAEQMDVAMLPLFATATTLTPTQQSLCFLFFVEQEGLYRRGADWWDEGNGVYRIPLAAIRETLARYLGVEAFDPIAAFGTGLRKVDYTTVPLGYYPEEQVYVTGALSGWDGRRITKVMDKRLLGNGKVEITVGFFNRKSDAEPFKYKIITLWEDSADRSHYRLLSVIERMEVAGRLETFPKQGEVPKVLDRRHKIR